MAIEILNSMPKEETEHSSLIKNNLAVAYILENRIDEALKLCEDILQIEPFNIHALCNMAMIKSRKDEKDEAKELILSALEQPEYDYSELLKISVALCDLEMHSWAADIFYELLDENPYDLHSRHFLALALFNIGQRKEALEHLKYIEKFKPYDSVNNWYIKAVKDVMAGVIETDHFPYVNQVSSSCVYERINRINELLKEADGKNPWLNKEFRELVLWAFEIKDDTLKSSMITLITKYAADEAPSLLRERLCSRHVSDDVKHRILMSLKKLGEKEPYIALMDNSIVEVNINTFEVNAVTHLDLQREIVELILLNMPEEYDLGYFKYIINTWNVIVAKDKLFDKISNPKLWAAALEYNFAEKNGILSSEQEICMRYSVDMHEMLELNKKINKLIEDYHNGHNVD
jgi:tetratricopeptide (TPR) repeat protein